MQRYILQCQTLDNLKRVRKSSLAGVFAELHLAEAYMARRNAVSGQNLVWNLSVWTDPAHVWVKNSDSVPKMLDN